MSTNTRVVAAALATGVALMSASGQDVRVAQQHDADDSRLTAAIVAKFPEFVQWPLTALAEGQVFVLCVTRAGAVERHLRTAVAGSTIHDHPVRVHVLHEQAAVGDCHLLFLTTDSPLPATSLLAAIATRPVLTVGDHPALLDAGAVLALRPVAGRLRFDANLDAARRSGLRLRSQLLRLAVQVRGDGS